MEFPGPACYIAGAMDILASHAARHPDKPALIEGERVWSWADLIDRRNRLGHALLELGLQPGEHVIIYAANSLEHALASTGAEAAAAGASFEITINLGSDTERYSKSIAIDPNDTDPNHVDTTNVIAAITMNKLKDDGGGQGHI